MGGGLDVHQQRRARITMSWREYHAANKKNEAVEEMQINNDIPPYPPEELKLNGTKY